jgi:hypothetical protein
VPDPGRDPHARLSCVPRGRDFGPCPDVPFFPQAPIVEIALGVPPDLPAALTRRALQIAYDPTVSIRDGAEHLVRLAKRRELPLRLALAHLRREREPDTVGWVAEHACALLREALVLASTPSSLTA